MSEKITFKQLVELIAKQSKQSESSANSFMHELVQIIESGLKDSGSVSISGFGKFELRWMKERSGVNPQTGDEITVPGQNKVVFKPYKALRETVNKPFANLKPEILTEKNESEKESEEGTENIDDTRETKSILSSEESLDSDAEDVESTDLSDLFDSDTEFDSDDPFGIDKKAKESSLSQDYNQFIDDLIFEKENPHFGQSGYGYDTTGIEQETEGDVLVLEREESGEKPKIIPAIPDESKMAREVQESGGFKWSYAAAVIIVMLALILLFWMMQRSVESLEETALTTSDQNQTEQVLEPSASESEDGNDTEATTTQGAVTEAGNDAETTTNQEEVTETGNDTETATNQEAVTEAGNDAETTANQQSFSENENEGAQPTIENEPSTPSSEASPREEVETESFTVESGQSLWNIAENELGNPYLWPAIYHLNQGQDELGNPNELFANADIEIPTFSDPDNLTEAEREQVALGYFSLYQWNRENNPDEARYFLWAVGVFSHDLLDQPPSDVDSQDLAFARNR